MTPKLQLAALLLLGGIAFSHGAVSVAVNGLAATIKNSHMELVFNSDATLAQCNVGGVNLANTGERTFYLDWVSTAYGLFTPTSIHVVEQTTTANRAHFYWAQEGIADTFKIELHYVMEEGVDGVYSYVKYVNDKGKDLSISETRMVYRYAASILTQGTNYQRSGTIPTGADLNQCTVVQDSTWEFSNGTYFSKYDYAAYIRQTNYHGMYGNGYGAFIVSASKDYNGGGPLKQELTVHQECLVLNQLLTGHFGTPSLNAEAGWTHIYGPWLLYFPTGGSNDQLVQAAANQVTVEQGKWPYAWMAEDEYPRIRGTVSGVVSGQTSATVVLWSSLDEEFQFQQKGYLYNAETDSTGYYMIENVRPGNYRIAAYPTAGLGSDVVVESTVTVTAGGREHVAFTLTEPANIIWSIGQANRLSNEFKYSNEPRNYEWEWKTPVTNTFTIGQSNPQEDWYYAQSQPGHWFIKYQDTKDGNPRTLRVAIAGSSKSHNIVYANGHIVGNTYYDNDHAIYRSAMQSGIYKSNVYTISDAQVVDGENTIDLWISLGQIMYDTISLQRG